MTDRIDQAGPVEPTKRGLTEIGTHIDGIIANFCLRHYDCETQEPQFTSRLAEAIEREMKHVGVVGMRLEVTAQELSDHGPLSREGPTGADLYISVVVDSPDQQFSKGMLVQAKWDKTVRRAGERRKLRSQSKRMLRRTEESYVWIYGALGVAVIPASEALQTVSLPDLTRNAKTVGNLISDGLNCSAGDRAIGRDTSLPLVESLNSMLTKLVVENGLTIVVTEPG